MVEASPARDRIGELRDRAAGLPHPALEAAALDHAEYLAQLGEQADLLRRQILLVVRDPVRAAGPDSLIRSRRAHSRNEDQQPSDGARKAAAARVVRRISEATDLLAPAGISVTPLDAAQATAVLATATNPDSPLPPSAAMAGADEVITNPSGPDPGLDAEEDFA